MRLSLDKQIMSLRHFVYLAGFFLAIHLAFTAYISSAFLASLIDDQYVGIIFSIASLTAIGILFAIPPIIRQFGNVQLITTLTILLLGILISLALTENSSLLIAFFIAYYILSLVIQYAIDLYLESVSDNHTTGWIRTVFIAVLHIALIISLILTGLILGSGSNYRLIFMISTIALVPFWYIASRRFKELSTHYKTIDLKSVISALWHPQIETEKQLAKILAIDFLINFFYAIMIIYMPIYLYHYIGLPWSLIGPIFAFAFLPFVILLPPLGILADRFLGEKEILTAGLIITGLACLLISLTENKNFLIWGGLLLLSRIGIAAAEGMKESYLFKYITSGDAGILSISRNTRPLAYVIAPMVTSLFLTFYDFRLLFAFLGLVMIFGLRYSLTLADTK